MNHSFPPIEDLLGGETLEIEYKEDKEERFKAQPLPDDKIAEALMGLSNANGGYLLLGVTDPKKGRVTITGLSSARTGSVAQVGTRLLNKFVRTPHLATCEYLTAAGRVFAFYIEPAEPPPHQLTSGGFKIRKDLGGKQGPENFPFLLSEMPQWEAQRGIHSDFSSRAHADLPISRWGEMFNPLAVSLFQSRIREGRINNSSLAAISNFEQQLEALGIVSTVDGRKVMSNAALILFGSNDIIRERIPNHRAQFQVIRDEAVVHNLFTDKPGLEHRSLLLLADRLGELFRSVIERKELMDGLFRIDIPDYGDDAVREAAMNAFIHRDYTQTVEVIIQITSREFRVTSPGGFYRDVTPQNILFHEPCPRNRCLAQACADLGLVEKSGRGVDRIFWDQIRFMRPLPSYADSTTNSVRLSLLGGRGSLEAIKWMFERMKDVDDLTFRVVHGGLVHVLLMDGQTTREEMIASLPGLSESDGRRAITELVDAGIISRIGAGRGQRLVLSEMLQTSLGKPDAYRNQVGPTDEYRRKSILEFIHQHQQISRGEAAKLLNMPSDVNLFRRIIKPLVDTGELIAVGSGSGTKYRRPNEQVFERIDEETEFPNGNTDT
ncbi:ATPase AAA [Capsulimonas corticalis]|uniref:ATPase AAA n=1 Tax=Capsulimonas corticalis TaxID=2219043 RepID=A0A402CZG6_9BACT|nr:ATP-binding protein [Capsulimonas corticalis]BDI29433.1 ATPase AAA [Capsulimonas corticalis]